MATIILIISLFLLELLLHSIFFFNGQVFGTKISKGLLGLLFRKMLKLSASSIAEATAGKLINLASGDLVRI